MYLSEVGLADVGKITWKIPDWAKKAGAYLVSATKVTVPTPSGPITVDLSKPEQVAALREALAGAQLTVGGRRGDPGMLTIGQRIEDAIPGGWVTIGVGAAAFLFYLASKKKGRRG